VPLLLLLGTPLCGALLLGLYGARRCAADLNVGVSLVTCLAACMLTAQVVSHGPLLVGREQFFIDPFNVFLVTLTAFVGLTTSIFSRPYMRVEMTHGRVATPRLRLYHSMYQLFMTTMLIALTTNNLGLLWVSMEAATLSTVLLVTLYRTPASLEAGWKYFILCGVGIAQALFGTILLYFAAEKVLGADGATALLWTHLNAVKGHLEPTVLGLAFVFLFVGYGTKVGLAPLHNWLPDAHAEGPTPISAVLSGLLLNVALYALLRLKMVLAANTQALDGGSIMIALGLVSLVFAAFMLYRRRDIKRLFAYSSIEHMGVITFAFGMGGPLANFAGLLNMTMHSLTKSAIFFAVGHIAQVKGTQRIADIRGLSVSHPALAAGLALGVVAIAGLPPFGVFTSEFMLVSSTFARQPLLAICLAAGLLIAFGALVLRLQNVTFGEPSGPTGRVKASYVPLFLHMAVVLAAGLWLPEPVVAWFRAVAALLG